MNNKRLCLLVAVCSFALCAVSQKVKINGVHYSLDKKTQTALLTGLESSYSRSNSSWRIPSSITYHSKEYMVTNIILDGEDDYFGPIICGIDSVFIPKTLKIDYSQFVFFDGQTRIIISPDHPDYTTINDVIFSKDTTTLCRYPSYKAETSYAIPATVREIIFSAFAGANKYLRSLFIPPYVQKINFFNECFPNLKEIYCFAKEIPNVYSSRYTNESCILYVDNSLVKKYKASKWKAFKNIEPMYDFPDQAEQPFNILSKSDDRNIEDAFLRKFVHIEKYLESNAEFYSLIDMLNETLRYLDAIKLEDGYVLDDVRSDSSTNNALRLCARKINTKRPSEKEIEELEGWSYEDFRVKTENPFFEPLLDHLVVTHEKMSIWQAFCLMQTYRFVGMRWHGCYEKIEVMYKMGQLFDSFNNHIYSDKMTGDFTPKIELTEQGAIIGFYYFNEWKGLNYNEYKITYDSTKKRIVSIEKTKDENLIPHKARLVY